MIKFLPKYVFIQDEETKIWYCGFRYGICLGSGKTMQDARANFLKHENYNEELQYNRECRAWRG
jgi:hypothetical protein